MCEVQFVFLLIFSKALLLLWTCCPKASLTGALCSYSPTPPNLLLVLLPTSLHFFFFFLLWSLRLLFPSVLLPPVGYRLDSLVAIRSAPPPFSLFGDEAQGGKLVPDETGSGERRQRTGCLRHGKGRTDPLTSIWTLRINSQNSLGCSIKRREYMYLFRVLPLSLSCQVKLGILKTLNPSKPPPPPPSGYAISPSRRLAFFCFVMHHRIYFFSSSPPLHVEP